MRKYYIGIAIVMLFAAASFITYYAISKNGVSDQTKIQDISELDREIDNYASKNKKLPTSLSELDLKGKKVKQRLADYTYKDLGRTKDGYDFLFEICTEFKTEKKDQYSSTSEETNYVGYGSGHAKGRDCFKLKAYAPYQPKSFVTPLSQSSGAVSVLAPCNDKTTGLTGKVFGSVSAINTQSRTVQVKKEAVTNNFSWYENEPTLYDKSCNKLAFSTLKVGDSVIVYTDKDRYKTVIWIN